MLLGWSGYDWFCLLQKNGLDDLQKSLPALHFYRCRPQSLQHSSVTLLLFLNPCEHVKLPNVFYELFINRIHILYFSLVMQRPDQILFFHQSHHQPDLPAFCIYLLNTGLFIYFFSIPFTKYAILQVRVLVLRAICLSNFDPTGVCHATIAFIVHISPACITLLYYVLKATAL